MTPTKRNEGHSRRGLLKKTAGAVLGAAAASITGALDARAQVQGLYTSNTPPELPLPIGSLTYLDQKQYIHNMEIISHLPGSTVSGGEPLMAMWAKGKQRVLPARRRFRGCQRSQKSRVLEQEAGDPSAAGPSSTTRNSRSGS